MDTLRIKKMRENPIIPTRATDGDAGLDLYAYGYYTIRPGAVVPVYTGIAVEIPHGYVGLIHPRSGLAAKNGVTVANAPGTIDAGYRGELAVLLVTLGDHGFAVIDGMRIAQLVIQKVELPEVEVVEELSESVRGAGGFGSTGV